MPLSATDPWSGGLPSRPVSLGLPHLGLGVDIYLSACFARAARSELASRGVPAVIAPPHYWGINAATGSFPGSFTVRDSTLIADFEDLIGSMRGWGFRRFYVINFHGDPHHVAVLQQAMAAVRETGELTIAELDPIKGETVPWPPIVPWDTHAGAAETTLMAAMYPGQVDEKLARMLPPQSEFEPNGYIGEPGRFQATGVCGVLAGVGRNLANQVMTVDQHR